MNTDTQFFDEQILIWKEKSERERERTFWDAYAYMARKFGNINQSL